MTLKYLCLSLLLLGGASLGARGSPSWGAWRQTDVAWKKPPVELEMKQRYADAAVLYFSSDHKFVLLYALVIQSATSEGISEGDGCVAYLGTWNLTVNTLHVQYRLVSRTVQKQGEMLPGQVQSEDVRLRGSTLFFQKHRFVRDGKLDDKLKATLQEESVHPGMSCENP